MSEPLPRRDVACAGCTLCCRDDAIVLHPEEGDDPELYETIGITHPLTGRPIKILAKAENGDCIYLDRATGCRIHDRAPAICRSFDCARFYAKFGASQLRTMVAEGLATQAVVDAGRKRLKSLRQSGASPDV